MNNTVLPCIRTFDDPILKQVCIEIGPDEDVSFLDHMELFCFERLGAGLAAPQIGVAKRAIYLRTSIQQGNRGSNIGLKMVNPRIVLTSDVMESGEEACFSYPGIFTAVQRHKWIDLEWENVNFSGKRIPCARSFVGYLARVVQHEMDHLNGICKVGDEWRRQRQAQHEELL